MRDYRNIFEMKYELSKKNVYSFFQYVEDTTGNKSYFNYNPFSKWGVNQSPEWWKTYTDLKHSQLKHLESATLRIVIYAYAALFLLCSQEKILELEW